MSLLAKRRNKFLFRNTSHSKLGRITEVGVLNESHAPSPFRHLRSYSIIYILDGHGQYQDTCGTQCTIGPGDLILIFPDVGHAYGPNKDTH